MLGDVAAAGAGEGDWLAALEALTVLLHGSTATIFLQRSADKTLGWVHQCGQFAPGDVYTDHYAKQDILFPAVLQRPSALSVSCSQLVERSDFSRTEFYMDFARPRDMIDCIHVRLFDEPAESLFFAVTRSHDIGIFNTADRAMVDLIAPHLARAVRNSRQLALLTGQRDTTHAAFALLRSPILIVDVSLRVHHANPAAKRILHAQDPLSYRDGKLIARRPADTDIMRRIVAHELAPTSNRTLDQRSGDHPGPALTLGRSQGNPLLLRVIPLHPGHLSNPLVSRIAMILLVDPDRIEQPSLGRCLRELYGLTPGEARVAAQVGAGVDLSSVAETLSMRRTTVRWYLQRIFEKTGTARQSRLVQLVERLGIAHPED